MPTQSIYISGPITGNPNFQEDFQHAASRLAAAGHIPINPAILGTGGGHDWDWYMRESIVMLVRQASAIAMLPGWENSRGARIEHSIAVALRLPMGTIADWCGGNPNPVETFERGSIEETDAEILGLMQTTTGNLRRPCPKCGLVQILPDMDDCGGHGPFAEEPLP